MAKQDAPGWDTATAFTLFFVCWFIAVAAGAASGTGGFLIGLIGFPIFIYWLAKRLY